MTKPTAERPPLLLVVDDKPENLDVVVSYLENAGISLSVALEGEEALALTKELQPDLILWDVLMPGIDGFETCRRLKQEKQTRDIPVIFMSALTETVNKVTGFKVGGVDYITKPLQKKEVLARIQAHLTIRCQQQQLAQQNADLQRLNKNLEAEIARRQQAEAALETADARLSALSEQEAKCWGITAFIGHSTSIMGILEEIRRLQQVDKTNVLVLGESGTGKELVARAIHFGSNRAKGPFVPVNCSAIPSELADAAFFGHVKGAFTGANSNSKGYFEQADGGTLFLDEMGDMPLLLQAKLLRVLEDRKLTPVGGSQAKPFNVRVVAATNATLEAHVAENTFRRDLFFRLAGYAIRLPPLRERKEDIPLLVEHFLSHFVKEMGYAKGKMTPEALEVLQKHDFPGNVLEMKNLIEYALISCGGQAIQPPHLHFMFTTGVSKLTAPSLPKPSAPRRTPVSTSPPIPATASADEPICVSIARSTIANVKGC
ncbi:MAG TPA: sigma-54-dependent Fis family transcriptional regulator [Thioploca sp.]|nr:sigma-54-dependent Fis family transcriptional regulator [Thioploca sp.]